MVREPDATMEPAPHDNQLMSKHRILGFKPHLRLEWRGQDGQNETKQPDHSASLGDSITSSTRIGFSVHTRTADRFDPTGMPRPRWCVRRVPPPSPAAVIHEILQWHAHASLLGEGCAV